MNVRRLIVVVVALAGWTLPAVASAQTTLRYKFKEGDSLKYVREQSMKMTRTVMGNVADVTVDQAADLTWTVQGVDSQGNAKIAIKFGQNKITMDTPMGKVVVDSSNAEEPDDMTGGILHKIIRGLSGLEVSGTVSPLGEYSDIKVPEKALADLRKIPGSNAVGDLLTPEGLQRVTKQSNMLLPQQAVSKGSSWKNGKVETKLPFGKSLVEIECIYDGPMEKGGRTLETILLKHHATLENDPKSEITVKLKSYTGVGTALFDNVAGRLLEAQHQENTEKVIDINGVTINERTVQTTKLRLVK